MPIKYTPIGFSFEEHRKYAQLCKIVCMYAPWSDFCNKLKWEMEKLFAHEGYKVNFQRGWRYPPENEHYSPYVATPEPTLPFYTLDECYAELRLLITNLKVSDAPACTAIAQKYAQKAIKHLERSSKTKCFPQYIKFVEQAGMRKPLARAGNALNYTGLVSSKNY